MIDVPEDDFEAADDEGVTGTDVDAIEVHISAVQRGSAKRRGDHSRKSGKQTVAMRRRDCTYPHLQYCMCKG